MARSAPYLSAKSLRPRFSSARPEAIDRLCGLAALVLAFVGLAGPVHASSEAPEELQELLANYEASVAEVAEEMDARQAGLDGNFTRALRTGMEQSAARDDLDAVLAFRNVLEAIGASRRSPEGGGLDSSAFARIAQMQTIYTEEAEKLAKERAARLALARQRALAGTEALERAFAEDGREEDALAARMARERLQEGSESPDAGSIGGAEAIQGQRPLSKGRLRVHGVFSHGQSAVPPDLDEWPNHFVSVDVFRHGWFALRDDGSGVVCSVPKSHNGPIQIRQFERPILVAEGCDFWFVNENRKYTQVFSDYWWPLKIEDPVIMAAINGIALLVNSKGESEVRGGNERTAPPAALLEGARKIVGTRSEFFIVDHDGNAAVWDAVEGRMVEGKSLPRGIVDVSAGEYHVVALDEEGKVHCWDTPSQSGTRVPRDLRGVKRIKAGGLMSAALTDRGWRAWGPDSKLERVVQAASNASELSLFAFGGTSIAIWIEPVEE